MDQFNELFKLGKRLGSGGDGDVYEAIGKPWAAIKKIKLYDYHDKEFELMKAHQEKILLKEANIATLHYIFYQEEMDEKVGKVMPFIYKVYDRYNWCLDDLIVEMKDVRMTEQQMKHVIFDVCKDIEKLHGQGFIHLDIKPSNILYCKNGTSMKNYEDAGRFKVIDWDGIKRNRSEDEDGKEILDEGIEIPWQGMSCL